MKLEQVVNPPGRPTVMVIRTIGVHCAMNAVCITYAMAKQPIRFTVSVRYGNPVPDRSVVQDPIR